MKKPKSIIEKLTSKQRFILSLLISIVVGIISFICCNGSTIERLMLSLVILMLCFIILFICLKVADKESEEGKEDAKRLLYTEYFLNKENFVEVQFIPVSESVGILLIMQDILNSEGCKFYAKINEDEDIILISKDKDEKIVYNGKISNYIFFTRNFKPYNFA